MLKAAGMHYIGGRSEKAIFHCTVQGQRAAVIEIWQRDRKTPEQTALHLN
jgi:hypothetical protein